MTEWGRLRDGYGSAEHVPTLLATAARSGADEDGLWDELWGRLCHQGTVYTASYAALPALADMSIRHEPGGYVAALHLAAAIVASNDGPEDSSRIRQRYPAEITELRKIAARNLQYAADDTEFVYGLQALMAFEDGGQWQRDLECLANGEASLQCPNCGEDLLLDLDSPSFRVVSFADASLAPQSVTPAESPSSMVEARLLMLARENGRTRVTACMHSLFGVSTCPRCQTPFEVPQVLA